MGKRGKGNWKSANELGKGLRSATKKKPSAPKQLKAPGSSRSGVGYGC